jgi:hypothetical protein
VADDARLGNRKQRPKSKRTEVKPVGIPSEDGERMDRTEFYNEAQIEDACSEDPLNPARSICVGLPIGILLWAVVFVLFIYCR